MISGFVKFQREIIEKDWFRDANASRLYMLLLASANFADNGIKRGQCKFTLAAIMDRLNISKKEVRNAICRLKKAGEISVKTIKGRAGFCLFTMLKYDETQGALLGAQNGAQIGALLQPLQSVENSQVTNENIKGGAHLGAQNEALLGAHLIYNKKYIEENKKENSSSRPADTQNFVELLDAVEYVRLKKAPEALTQLSEIMLMNQSDLSKILDEFAVANIDHERMSLAKWGKYFQACKGGLIARIKETESKPKNYNNADNKAKRRSSEITATCAADYYE